MPPDAGATDGAADDATAQPTDGATARAPDGAAAEAIAEQVFVALADPSRRAILAELAATGAATATDLAAGPAPSTWPCWPRPAW
jgi:hypothetical protein